MPSGLSTWKFLLCLWLAAIAGAWVTGGHPSAWWCVFPVVVIAGEICGVATWRRQPSLSDGSAGEDQPRTRQERKVLREIGDQRLRDTLALRELERRLAAGLPDDADLTDSRRVWLMELGLWAQGNDLPVLAQRTDDALRLLAEVA